MQKILFVREAYSINTTIQELKIDNVLFGSILTALALFYIVCIAGAAAADAKYNRERGNRHDSQKI